MLKKIRIALGAFFAVCITFLFLDFTGSIHAYLAWMAKLQFLPAVLSLNFAVIILLLILTFAFGRIYCSVICPAGVLQDVFFVIGNKFTKKNRMTFVKEKKILRFAILGIFVILFLFGLENIASLVAPYSAFGRIASNLMAPIYQSLNNVCASIAEHYGSYAFYSVDVWIKSLPVFIVAILHLIIFAVLAFRGGRDYCNTICPVGTVLGYFSKFAFFKINIDKSKCNKCGLCSKNCKSKCIDSKNQAVDYSRCVDCFDCIYVCKKGAISFSKTKQKASNAVAKEEIQENSDEKVDSNLRSFLTAGLFIGATSALKAQEVKLDGGLAILEEKKQAKRSCDVKPAGSISNKNFKNHCISCQLCVSVCPNKVLRPSSNLEDMMQPTMSFEYGFCRPECTKCSEVCPTSSISQISKEEKSSTRIGYAVLIEENCISASKNEKCGSCAAHCPTGAINMVNKVFGDENSPKIPAINKEVCIGCGKCEYLCPSRPFSAIYVEGREVHSTF